MEVATSKTVDHSHDEIPHGNLQGFIRYIKYDLVSGFLVFLIALPLCLGISIASGFPPIAGVFTAIAGALITMFFSNSELTIKGPAAGLIVIVLGAVQSFGFTEGANPVADHQAYRMALAVAVVAGVIQIVFGLVRAGVVGDFFPISVVHGMLAAIGVIIMVKQLPVVVGQSAKGEPLEIIRELPEKLMHANPEIALIGAISLAIMFGLGFIKAKSKNAFIKALPSPLVVLLVAVPMGMWFDLSHEHTYSLFGHNFQLGEKFLVPVPKSLLGAVTTPDFSAFTNAKYVWSAAKWVIMFSLIGSLESMLSAKAIDMIDPWKRKTNLNRDLVGVGIANTLVAFVGGLPMISEIVRSKANLDNGARTKFANFWHGIFMLSFVALLPQLIHRVPLAALAAMLVYTGFRLASPREFINVYKIGSEQLIIFVTTLLAVLATDLLIGIGIGIIVKLTIHLINGLPLRSVFLPYLEVTTQDENTVVINAKGSAVFSNFIPFKRQIEQLGLVNKNNVVVDLSACKLVDHSVMEKMHELQLDFEQAGLTLDVRGLDAHRTLSAHPFSTRKKGLTSVRRITMITDPELEPRLVNHIASLGASGYTSVPCVGVGRAALSNPERVPKQQVRIEVITRPDVALSLVRFVEEEMTADDHITLCIETVEVNRQAGF